jgi:magnesium and cobalt transporter
MSEGRPRPSHSTWIARVKQAVSGEPQNQEQLLHTLRHAQAHHILDADCLSIIEGAMQVAEMQVREIMIPRAQMTAIKSTATPKEFLPIVIESTHSRFPVVGENPNDIIGILLAKDLLRLSLNGNEKFDIKDVLRPVTFVPESKRLNVLLKEFRANRNHMAVVIDEYGSVSGIATIEDVLEQIVGEIEDEHDIDDENYIRPSDDDPSCIVKAMTPIDEFNDHFKSAFDDEAFDTIGGLVVQSFGHLPRRDEITTIGDFQFKVLNADNRRVHLLQVTPLTKV